MADGSRKNRPDRPDRSARFAYVAYPYVTLARLGAALGTGDAKTLEKLVAWGPVREGIKEDICDDVPDDAGGHRAAGCVPSASPSRTRVASNLVDAHVSPHGILAAAAHFDPGSMTLGAVSGVKWAFFESPTEFVAELQPPGIAARPAASAGADGVAGLLVEGDPRVAAATSAGRDERADLIERRCFLAA